MINHQSISSAFPFESNYLRINGSKMHYVDEGSGNPILFLHGQPTSSYIWRNIIPYLSSIDRCIAIDLIGMGKSDKPDIEYFFFDHVNYLEKFIKEMKLKDITLVVQDWGSALGFHYAMRHEDNIKGIAFMEAILMPFAEWNFFPGNLRKVFQAFRTPDIGWEMLVNKNIFVEQILPGAVIRDLSEEEMSCYREPFKSPDSRKPVWRLANELPIAGDPPDVTKAVDSYHKKLLLSDLPKLLIYGTPGGLISPSVVKWCKENLKNLQTANIGKGFQYLQEDNPHKIGRELANWYRKIQ